MAQECETRKVLPVEHDYIPTSYAAFPGARTVISMVGRPHNSNYSKISDSNKKMPAICHCGP